MDENTFGNSVLAKKLVKIICEDEGNKKKHLKKVTRLIRRFYMMCRRLDSTDTVSRYMVKTIYKNEVLMCDGLGTKLIVTHTKKLLKYNYRNWLKNK